jgi:hypothetical protein
MDRNTVVRIAIPLSLYESVKGKVIKEEKGIEEISAQTKYNAVKKATQDAESERGVSDDLFRARRRQQAMDIASHINPTIESEARKIADMLTQSEGGAGFRVSVMKLNSDKGPYVELEFMSRANTDYNIRFIIKKDSTKVVNQQYIPKELERKLSVFVDKIRKAELDINTDDSTSSMNEAKKPIDAAKKKADAKKAEAKKAAEKKAADIKKKKEEEASKAEAEKKKAAEAKKKAKA